MLARAWPLLLVASLSMASVGALAQGEHGRRAAAELRVMAADVQRLQQLQSGEQPPGADADTTTRWADGLRQRLLGGLATLDIILRLADQERLAFAAASANANAPERVPGTRATRMRELTDSLRRGDTAGLAEALADWLIDYPLDLPGDDVVISVAAAQSLHQAHCAACHDTPASAVDRPAYNLFDEARRLDDEEFFARLVVGVRGDRVTGLGNPLSDAQLSGLMRFYRESMSR